MKSKIIVFAPHPDDETLGCGGTIARRVSEGYEVLVVVLTDGRNAFLTLVSPEPVPAPSELKEIRKEEVERAVRILGVPGGSLVFLGFEDGTLCQNEGRVKEEVSNILSRNSPTEVYFPYEKDVSMDHRVTNRVVRDSIEELDLDAVGYKYSILQKHVHFGPRMDVFLSFFKRNMIRVDISEFLPLKEKALKQFRSQVTTISRMQQKPVVDNIERFLKREESFLRC